jgi:hypothetical protein
MMPINYNEVWIGGIGEKKTFFVLTKISQI